MTNQQRELILSTFKHPFKYESTCQMIFDSAGDLVANVRGWGKIQYMEDAELRQDAFGEFIAEAMNNLIYRSNAIHLY